MGTDPFTSSPIHLTQARRRADGSHSSHDLSEAQRRGELLRLRAGIYVDAHDWISAPPWRRYDLSVAATALSRPSTLFCRESALLLHGLPLLRSPAAVLARTRSYNYAGTHPAPPLPGRAGASAFRRRFIAHHPQDPSPTARDLRGVPTKLLEAAIPPGSTRASMRRVVRDEGFSLPEVRLGAASLPGETSTSSSGFLTCGRSGTALSGTRRGASPTRWRSLPWSRKRGRCSTSSASPRPRFSRWSTRPAARIAWI